MKYMTEQILQTLYVDIEYIKSKKMWTRRINNQQKKDEHIHAHLKQILNQKIHQIKNKMITWIFCETCGSAYGTKQKYILVLCVKASNKSKHVKEWFPIEIVK